MFEALSERLDSALDRVRGRGRLDEKTVDETLKEIRLALLEADVNYKVVKELVARLREKLVGEEVSEALNPSQEVVKAVSNELERALGGETVPLELDGGDGPAVIMLAGLQGSGKTTAAGKLGRLLSQRGRRPMLVACDLQRPAAVEQLRVNAEAADVHVYAPVESGDPVPVAEESLDKARQSGCDVVVIDTAGRLHVDEEMMRQARQIRDVTGGGGPGHETLFVIDAMIGQEAVNVSRSFLDEVGFDGVLLTKLDGDARGGAALSVREVTGKPIKLAATGETLDDLEVFHPDRLASRILGMGDVETLIEKAEQAYTEEEAAKAEEAILSGEFTLDDFLEQMQMLKKMGPLQGLLGMLPGIGQQLKDVDIDPSHMGRIEAMIRSMTPEERRDPKNQLKRGGGSRKRRIADGSGVTVTEVNQLVSQFLEAKKMMESVSKMAGTEGSKPKGLSGGLKQAKAMRQLQQSGGLPGKGGGGMGGFPGLRPSSGDD